MKTRFLLLLLLGLTVIGSAQDKHFKLVSYNSLRYSPNNIDARHPDLNDLDIAFYYKTEKFSFISISTYPTALQDIYHFQIILKCITDTLYIFGVHLKTSNGSINQ